MQRDAHPLTRGHCLVTPRRHAASFFECAVEERMAMPALPDEVQALIDRELAPDACNHGLDDGSAAGQTVMHVHLHLIPRYAGDAADPRGGVCRAFPQKAAYRAQDES